MGEECVLRDRLAPEEMLLQDGLQDLRRAVPVPGALGIDDCDRAAGADLEAIGLGPRHQGFGPHQSEFLQASLEEFPGLKTRLGDAALGLAGSAAEQDVALDGGDTVPEGDALRGFGIG